MPPNRKDNPMTALELLGHAEYRLFSALWYLPAASMCSKAVRDILWSMELLQAALEEEFKISCRRLKIPVAPRGYWAKRSSGQAVRRPRLPALPIGQAEEIVIRAKRD